MDRHSTKEKQDQEGSPEGLCIADLKSRRLRWLKVGMDRSSVGINDGKNMEIVLKNALLSVLMMLTASIITIGT